MNEGQNEFIHAPKILKVTIAAEKIVDGVDTAIACFTFQGSEQLATFDSDREPHQVARMMRKISPWARKILLNEDAILGEMAGLNLKQRSPRWGVVVTNREGNISRAVLFYQELLTAGQEIQMKGDFTHFFASTPIRGPIQTTIVSDTEDDSEVILPDIPVSNGRDISLWIQAVAAETKVGQDEIFGPVRLSTIAEARQLLMYVLRKQTTLSLKEIGLAVKRHHTTVLSACNAMEIKLGKSKKLRLKLSKIMNRYATILG